MGQVVQLELFRVTAAEPPWRDNRDAMEFPFLSLQKNRTKPLEYQAGDVSDSGASAAPGAYSAASGCVAG